MKEHLSPPTTVDIKELWLFVEHIWNWWENIYLKTKILFKLTILTKKIRTKTRYTLLTDGQGEDGADIFDNGVQNGRFKAM